MKSNNNNNFKANNLKAVITAALTVSFLSFPAYADMQSELEALPAAEKKSSLKDDLKIIPFVFSTEAMGFTFGAGGIWKNAGQAQASILGAGMGSKNGTWFGFLSANNYTIAPDSSWLFSAQYYQNQFKGVQYFTGTHATNNASNTHFVNVDSKASSHFFSAKYILPIGAVEGNNPIGTLLSPNRAVEGYTPWTSGITTLELRPIWQSRELKDSRLKVLPNDFSTAEDFWALEGRYTWDNRNSMNRPSAGSFTDLTLSADFGDKDRASWLKWQLNQSVFYELPKLPTLFEEQVLAFNFYTADTPTWNKTTDINGKKIYNRPPEFAGVSLGGFDRQRSYPSGRFIDRSAINYSLEYRMVPKWQPLGKLPILNWYNLPWWQWVAFGEFGRVANEFDLKELHQQMKWSAGIAMRFEIEGLVIRSEYVAGSGESAFRIMLNHPF